MAINVGMAWPHYYYCVTVVDVDIDVVLVPLNGLSILGNNQQFQWSSYEIQKLYTLHVQKNNGNKIKNIQEMCSKVGMAVPKSKGTKMGMAVLCYGDFIVAI